MKKSQGEKIFQFFNVIIMIGLCIVMLYPLWHIFMASISDPVRIYADRGFYLLPKGKISLQGYRLVFENPNIVTGMLTTLFYVFAGTILCMVVTIMGAYVLSRKNLYWNRPVTKLIVFTMYFQGGLIPFFILVKNLGLLNSHWAVILPFVLNTWNLIVLRTAFAGMPQSLIDSAQIDGASQWRILWQIVVPVSRATVAVIALFYGVRFWNEWFNPSIFLMDKEKYPLQLVLREILLKNNTNSMTQIGQVGQMGQEKFRMLVKYCTIIVSTVPILTIYPFIQKYFVSGVMIGSLKE